MSEVPLKQGGGIEVDMPHCMWEIPCMHMCIQAMRDWILLVHTCVPINASDHCSSAVAVSCEGKTGSQSGGCIEQKIGVIGREGNGR